MHGTGVFEQMLHATSPRGGHDAIRGEKRARKEEGKEAAPLARATRALRRIEGSGQVPFLLAERAR
jgi:hypothetical protein